MKAKANCCLLMAMLVCGTAAAQKLGGTASDRPGRLDSPVARVTGPIQHLQALAGGGATMDFELRPMYNYPGGSYSTGGCYTQGNISGNTLTIVEGTACRTYWNVFMSNWDPDGGRTPPLRGYQARIDSATLSNGVGGDLVGADQSCSVSSDCVTAFGESGPVCGNPTAGKCRYAWVNRSVSRSDRFIGDTPPPDCPTQIFDSSLNPPGPVVFGVTDSDISFPCAMTDPHVGVYGGTFAFDAPANAQGTYTVEFLEVETFGIDPESMVIPLAAITPGVLVITSVPFTGSCCFGIGTASEGCADGLLESECGDDEPGPVVWEANGNCATACDGVFPTGACCSQPGTLDATCTEGLTYSECLDEPGPVTWVQEALCSEVECEPSVPAETSFTYQGFLKKSGAPVDGPADVRFSLWTEISGGTQLGPELVFIGLPVSQGVFSADLDFGAPPPFDGSPRWLQMSVRTPSGVGSYTLLSPRVRLSPVPEAFHADLATAATALDAPDGNPMDAVRVDNAGRVGIGRNAAANQLEVEGDASKTTAGDWLANSDRSIKTQVRTIGNALDVIQKLRPVAFRYTEDYKARHPSVKDQDYYNYIAQEFREVFPHAVQNSGEDGLLQMDSYPTSVYAVAAIKELHELVLAKDCELSDMRDRNDREQAELRSEISDLKSQISELKTLVKSLTSQSAGGEK